MKNIYLLLVAILVCVCASGQTNSKELVFVGSYLSKEKISEAYRYIEDSIPHYSIRGVPAYYRVKYYIEKIYSGEFQGDTISFIASNVNFSDYNHFLLFLHLTDSCYIADNEYIGVFPTDNNRWACDYSFKGGQRRKSTDPSPIKIEFKDTVSFDISRKDQFYIKRYYPEPYYLIVGKKAIVMYGYYVDDLLKILSGRIGYRDNGKTVLMRF